MVWSLKSPCIVGPLPSLANAFPRGGVWQDLDGFEGSFEAATSPGRAGASAASLRARVAEQEQVELLAAALASGATASGIGNGDSDSDCDDARAEGDDGGGGDPSTPTRNASSGECSSLGRSCTIPRSRRQNNEPTLCHCGRALTPCRHRRWQAS